MDQELHKTAFVGRRRIDLYIVAVTQRRLILLIGTFVLLQLGFMFGSLIGRGMAPSLARLFILGIALGYVVAWVLSVVAAALLARRIAGGFIMVGLTAVVMIIPMLNLLWLVGINGRATAHITRAGVKVGFLGVTPADMAGLVEGACMACGYDIRSVTADRCPECGSPLAASRG